MCNCLQGLSILVCLFIYVHAHRLNKRNACSFPRLRLRVVEECVIAFCLQGLCKLVYVLRKAEPMDANTYLIELVDWVHLIGI